MSEITDEGSGLYLEARANLNDSDLAEFHRYKDELKNDGEPWEEAEDILSGFIWEYLENDDSF